MPFLTGAHYRDATINELPWVQEDIYHESILPVVNYTVYNQTRPASEIIIHPQTLSQLFAILYQQLDVMFYFEQRALTCSSHDIAALKTENIIPHSIQEHTRAWDYDPEHIGFILVISNKFNQQLFPALDKIKPDEKAISMIFQESINHRVRVYKEANGYCYRILTNQWSWDMARKLIALMPRLFPHLQVSDEVHELCKLFGGTDFEAWTNAYNAWITKVRPPTKIISHEDIEHLFKHILAKQITDLTKMLNKTNSDINNYEQTLAALYRAAQDYREKIYHQKNKNLFSDELIDYIQKNKAIVKCRPDPSLDGLRLLIRTPLHYYDQNAFDAVANNPRSELNKTPEKSMLFKAIYSSTPNLELWTDTWCRIRLMEAKCERVTGYNHKLLPHPHIYAANCWGDNRSYIEKALIQGEYISAIEQIIAATKNLNWFDGTIINWLLNAISSEYDNRKTFKIIGTDTFLDYNEAIAYLTNKETEQNEKEMTP